MDDTTWINLEEHSKQKNPYRKSHLCDSIYVKCQIGKSIKIESRLVVARGQAEVGLRSYCLMDMGFVEWYKYSNLEVMKVASTMNALEATELYAKMVNFMSSKFYLNYRSHSYYFLSRLQCLLCILLSSPGLFSELHA